MNIGVPRESFPGERRVAVTPMVLSGLHGAGLQTIVQAGAGIAAGFADAAYHDHGAEICRSRAEVFARADVIIQVRVAGANPATGHEDLPLLRPGHTLIGFADPLARPDLIAQVAARGVACFALELIPRISRAQSMDALSAMATVAGYKAVLIAAERLPKMFPMLITAAGTVIAARVLVIGAGVAGLQAIATARRLGATVVGFDVRPAAKGHILSLGAKVLDVPSHANDTEDTAGYAKALGGAVYEQQRRALAAIVRNSDVIISTAAVPGKPAPRLISADMVARMASGSLIMDLAADRGGNCELTRADELVVAGGVSILGPTNLPASVPFHASSLYAKTVSTFVLALVDGGGLTFDRSDPVVSATLTCQAGEVVHPELRKLLNLPTVAP